MKLHLPSGLRTALLACIAAVSGFAPTLSTATLAGGAFVAAMASVAEGQIALVGDTGGKLDTTWDTNWGAAELADAPKSLTSTTLDASTALADAYYKVDGSYSILAVGTSEDGAKLYGGASGNLYYSGTVEADTWIKATGGDYLLIAGGNNCAANENVAGVVDFKGDSHIYVAAAEGGTALSIDYIAGGNYKDGYGADFTGDSYITLASNSLQGAVIGGNIAAFESLDAYFTGNSHIYIYVPQTLKSDKELESDKTGNLNAIIGGSVEVAKNGGTLQFVGDTNILLDFADYRKTTSDAATISKHIIGGSMRFDQKNATQTGDTHITICNTGATTFSGSIYGGAYGATSTINGDTYVDIHDTGTGTVFVGHINGGSSNGNSTINGSTHVSIRDAGNTAFKEVIVGGMETSYTSTITGGTNLTIATGAETTFAKDVIGGSKGQQSTVSISGKVQSSISGGTFVAMVIGGCYDHGYGSKVTLGAVELALSGGTYKGVVVGGIYNANSGTAKTDWTFNGDILVTVSGSAALNSTLYGGSYTQRNTANKTYAQRAITVDLQGGTLKGDVYAAGHQDAATTFTTESTTVKVSSKVVLGSADKAITVSGGYEFATGANGSPVTGSTVTGHRTLEFTSTGEYSNLDHVTFKDFDAISVVEDGSIALSGVDFELGTSLTKAGKGELVVDTALTGIALAAEGGTLTLSAATNTLASLALSGSGTVVDLTGTAVALGGALTANGGTLKLGEKGLDLAGSGTLAVTDGSKLTLDLGKLTGTFEETVFTGVANDVEQLGLLTFNDDPEAGKVTLNVGDSFAIKDLDAATLAKSYFKLVGDATSGYSVVLTNKVRSTWVWDGTSDVWRDQGDNGWEASSGDSTDHVVYFTDDGIAPDATVETVTISGAVTPVGVMVDVSEGHGYTFTGSGSIDGTAYLTKSGAGGLNIETANSYSGGTTIEGGTLTAECATALGTGGVNLKGGTLALALAIDNDINFNGGTLKYQDDAKTSMDQFSCDAADSVKVNVAADKTATWTTAAKDHSDLFANGMTLDGTGTLAITDTYGATLSKAGAENYQPAFEIDGNLSITGTGTTTFYAGELWGSGSVVMTNVNATVNTVDAFRFGGDLTMTGGSLTFDVNAVELIAGMRTKATYVLTMSQDADFNGTQIIVNGMGDGAAPGYLPGGATEGIVLAQLARNNVETTIEKVLLQGDALTRHFKNARVVGNTIVADFYLDYYSSTLGRTENGTTGIGMAEMAAFELNPQGAPQQYKDLAGVLDALDDYADAGTEAAAKAADKLGAAVAGSGVAAYGMALSADVERQLKAIRNRTTTMGVNQAVVNEDMPYFNAWINAEGDYRSMDDDETMAGFTMNSWGGTVGFDIDCCESFTCGLAVTAMYGDFSTDAADRVEGDVDTCYVSAFGRVASGAWVHTFVATVGTSSSTLERTVNHVGGSYRTEGEADGTSFGLLYEVARTFALNEDMSACWQPVFNVSYRHVAVDAFEEEGSDAALEFGEQSLDTVTFGLGARVQAVVGESIYNRTSIFEARVLAKLDTGDTQGEVESALLMSSASPRTVKGTEAGAFGVEAGLGLTIPLDAETSSLFFDASLEYRASYVGANATMGYRVNF